jgi:DNA polymerase III epsilon subunit-like protein
MKPLAIIDLESTGTRPETDRIVSIAIIVQQDGEQSSIYKLVNPGPQRDARRAGNGGGSCRAAFSL